MTELNDVPIDALSSANRHQQYNQMLVAFVLISKLTGWLIYN